MSPHWLGSPQHIVAGVILAALVAAIAKRWVAWPLAALLALSMTMTAEAMVEVAEWPVLYGSNATPSAYYDTIADIGATLAGALAGTVLGLLLRGKR